MSYCSFIRGFVNYSFIKRMCQLVIHTVDLSIIHSYCEFVNYSFILWICQLFIHRKEGRKFLFNDVLNTFYLRLYGVRHMVKDHSDSERGNLLLPHGLLFSINSKGFYMHHPTQDTTYHGLCYISHGELAGTRNSCIEICLCTKFAAGYVSHSFTSVNSL